jgi:hypothetical protein
MSFGPWVDLSYDEEEMVDNSLPTMPEKPSYPYGLRICLCARELEKLGLSLPKVGELLDMRAMAEVTSVSDGEMGQRVEMTIAMMRLEDEDDDDA